MPSSTPTLASHPTAPILDFDPQRQAFIEPSVHTQVEDVPEHCVLCFFKDVIDHVVANHPARVVVHNRWEDGPHPIYEIIHAGKRVAFYHPGIGSALSSSLLEEAIAFGCRKFIACGGCGVLEPGIAVGHLVVLASALRDEGASYHYLPPGRDVSAHPAAIAALQATLEENAIPFRLGKTWTTDAPYRETPGKIALRRQEGCSVVEMEAAGLFAVAEFRSVPIGQVVYGGDDLSGEEWDHRSWHSRRDIRERLFWLSIEACLKL